MFNILAVNGSPKLAKGRTAMVLQPFLDELEKQGGKIDLIYPNQLKIKPCNCGRMYCWRDSPGKCIHKDDMETIFPIITQAKLIVFATPIYVPMPGEMQKFLNRLTPLLKPKLEFHHGRTHAQFREGILVERVILVASGGWWEIENLDRLSHIFKEFAAVANISFGGAILRPHAQMMMKDGQFTVDGQKVIELIRIAAHELIQTGMMNRATLEGVSKPLISRDEYFNRKN